MDTYITLQQNDFRKPNWKHVESLSGTTYVVKRAGWVHVQFGCGPKWMCINGTLVAYSAHGGTMVTLPVSRTDKITVSDFEDMSHLLELSDCSLFDIAYFVSASYPTSIQIK